MFFLKLEKIQYSLRGVSNEFYSKWQSFLSFFKSLPSLPPDWWICVLQFCCGFGWNYYFIAK